MHFTIQKPNSSWLTRNEKKLLLKESSWRKKKYIFMKSHLVFKTSKINLKEKTEESKI